VVGARVARGSWGFRSFLLDKKSFPFPIPVRRTLHMEVLACITGSCKAIVL
jgi:hypothetical protein